MSLYCSICKVQNRPNARFCSKCGATLQGSRPQNKKILGQRYVIEKLIKSGGMGSIYRAKHIKLDEFCAVKEMTFTSTDPRQNQYAMKRFYEEAKLLSRLRHPNLPVVTDYFDENNKYYIVMDFIDGEDLHNILEREGNPGLPEKDVIVWAKEVLQVLDYLHSQTPPIIYRDIKPSNIMIRKKDGKVMLVDFGIAKAIQGNFHSPQTAIGTFGYAPIEQYRGKVEPRSDLYALGAAMHYVLTGIEPVSCQHEPVRKAVPHLSEDIEKILKKVLQEKAEDRFSSAKDMMDALEKIKIKKSVQSVSQYRKKNSSDAPPLSHKRKISLKDKKYSRIKIKDETFINEIRTIINNWGKKESWFAKDFGGKIDIAEVNREKAFIISCEVLYMERKVKEGIEPRSDIREKIAPYREPSYKSLKDFPILSPPGSFTTSLDENYIFPDSKQIFKCSKCTGTGEILCRSCRGKGLSNKTRKFKKNSPEVQQKCKYCSGTGKATCDVCNGYKEIINYIYFVTKYYPVYFTNIIYNGRLDTSALQNSSAVLIYEEEIFNRKKSSSFDAALIKDIQDSPLREHFNSIMAEVSTHYKDKKKILNIPLKIKLSIEEIIIREVNFRDKKKINTIWLYGTGGTHDRVHLENRPLLWATGDIIGGVKSMIMGKKANNNK